MANKLQKISNKKVTKKQFILLVVAAAAAVSFGGLLNIIKKDKVSASTGYGSRGYGV